MNLFLHPFLMALRLLLVVFAVPALLFTIILYAAVNNTAIIQKRLPLNNTEIQRAKIIIDHSASKKSETIQLSKEDLNIALNYLLNFHIPSTSEISSNKDQLTFKIAVLLNKNVFGKYLNFSFKLNSQLGYPQINSLQIGNIKIANEFAGLIIESIIKYSSLKEYYILAVQYIRDIKIKPEGLTINYISTTDLILKNKLSHSKNYHQSVPFYQQKITQIIAKHNPKWRLSLADLLQPLFKLAYQRSSLKNARAENRAVLIAISSYVNKGEFQAFLPIDISPLTNQQYPASLYRRTDMAKHFMISAVLTATGAETLADIIGQEKELSDAKKGSGFSFIDLAGDRAGLRFGKTAVASRKEAKLIQKKMSKIKDYTAFMPEVRDLPENMSEKIFKQKFGSISSIKYQKMLEKIDQRIAKLAIYN